MTDRNRAIGLLAIAIVASATSWVAAKVGLTDATPVWYALGRAWLATLAGFALLLALGKFRRPTRADLPVILSVGTLQLGLFFMLINLGIARLPAGRSIVIAYTTTLWIVPLAGPLIGEWPNRRQLLGVAIGFAGVIVLLWPALRLIEGADGLAGYGFLLAAALSWALAILHARRHRWHLTPLQVMPWQMLYAAVLLIPLALLTEPGGRVGWSLTALVPLAFIGLVAGPLITWSTTSVARMLPAVAASLGFLLTPAAGIALSTLWLGEPLGLDLLFGAALVLAGAAVAILAARSAMEKTGARR
ncbi:MAG: DMT family transporter [Rhodospirillales bacterium]|nr:DMT family transporter [Rhodospirillales bacterium]